MLFLWKDQFHAELLSREIQGHAIDLPNQRNITRKKERNLLLELHRGLALKTYKRQFLRPGDDKVRHHYSVESIPVDFLLSFDIYIE